MTRDEISDLVGKLGDIIGVLREADPADRAEVYRQLGLRLTYHPAEQEVRVQAQPDADSYGEMVRVRGGLEHMFPAHPLEGGVHARKLAGRGFMVKRTSVVAD